MSSYDFAHPQSQRALKKYNALYDNTLLAAAKEGHDENYANLLIDDALAICGSPLYVLSRQAWDEKALRFLAQFSHEEEAIFLAGNLSDGFEAYGPYSDLEEAFLNHPGEKGWGMTLVKKN
jgi:hypothetical protein